jgi:hypothetical protein
MPGAPPKAAPAAPIPSTVNVGRLRAKLSSLEAQMVEAKGNYPDDHPRLRSLRQQIADVQRDLGDLVKESTSVSRQQRPGQDQAAFAEMVAALKPRSRSRRRGALRERATRSEPVCPRTAGVPPAGTEGRRTASWRHCSRTSWELLASAARWDERSGDRSTRGPAPALQRRLRPGIAWPFLSPSAWQALVCRVLQPAYPD